MKKTILTAVMLFAGLGLFAQNTPTTEVVQSTPLTSRGFRILPEKGDFAIGIDAVPFFQYIGNAFNGTAGNTAPTFGNGFGIFGKYFLENDRSIRVGLNFNMHSVSQEWSVPDNDPTSDKLVNDKWSHGVTNWGITAGYEFHRGYRRLQGFYGGEIMFMYENSKDVYEYGNEMSATYQTPASHNFNGNVVGNTRTLENHSGAQFTFGLGAFAGVDYFIASKISIGAEVGLGFAFSTKGQGEGTTQEYTTEVKETTTEGIYGFSSSLGFITVPRGNINIAFYF